MNRKALVAGHICLDITPRFPRDVSRRPGDLLLPGSLTRVGRADIHLGGAVANTGLAMKRLGTDVSLVGKVGRDVFGDLIRGQLRTYGAEGGVVESDADSSSYSVILAVPGMDRAFLHHPGANDSFVSSDIPQTALEEAALLHFGYPPLMGEMFRCGGRELISVMKRARAAGLMTSLDMASVDPASEAGQADWEKILEGTLPLVDFFLPSAEELCYMLDRERYGRWRRRATGRDVTEALDPDRDIRPLAEKCMALGAKVLLIKCGAPGLYYRTAGEKKLAGLGAKAGLEFFAWAEKEGFERSYVPDAVVSGTGAGDACAAGFLSALLKGRTLEQSLHVAAACGALSVSACDALSGLPGFTEVENRIRSGWPKRGEGENHAGQSDGCAGPGPAREICGRTI